MRRLRNVPIKRKLTILTLLTSCVALLVACLAFVAYELWAFRAAMVVDLSSTAAMLGDNSSAALAFNDPASAEQTLKSLQAHPHIVGAAVYERSGRPFATYLRAKPGTVFSPPAAQPPGYRFTDRALEVFRSINLAGESVGTVYIQSDLQEIRDRLWRYALIVLLVMIAASAVAYLLATRLLTSISEPISRLAGVVGIVATEKDYSIRAAREGEDELGRLIDGFNHMLAQIQERDAELQRAQSELESRVAERTRELQLEVGERQASEVALRETHQKLLEASRHAGMAEIATNVLHNVGNVLNSLNVSASLLADSVKKSKVAGLVRTSTLLAEHHDDLASFLTADSRGRHLPAYLAGLAEHLVADQESTAREIASLRANIDHIKEIVAMQQSYAKVSGVMEVVGVAELVEDCVRINGAALERHGVEVVRDFTPVPRINVDKHKILQILVNLVRNAKYACEESLRGDKRVTLRVDAVEGRTRISVIDNGVGIVPENLARIFNHGFTTRESGHGFGLHSGALAAQEIGGSLQAFSEGLGRGATFVLELPAHSTEPSHE
jgi:signal transduction histidine kinase